MKKHDAKATNHPANRRASLWIRLLQQFRRWFTIPYGYQDQSGFHYGRESVPVGFTHPKQVVRILVTDRACDAMRHPIEIPVEAPSVESEVEVPIKR